MDVVFDSGGIYLPEIDLWLDPEGDRPVAFISHGHADHASGAHGEVICSAVTAEVHQLRAGAQSRHRVAGWGEPFLFREARLTLFPAGHILGAAQLLVEWKGQRLVYTGDLKLNAGLCADEATIVPCDQLIIESTFGLPIFQFIDADEARSRILEVARQTLEAGQTPVFLGYPLGRGQEIVEVLLEGGVPVAAHGAVFRYLDVYARHTGRRFDAEPYDREKAKGKALVGPGGFGRQLSRARKDVRIIAVSGWALLDSARARYGADVLIPYSDHASFPELLSYVQASGAEEVSVVHGFAAPFAAILQQRGIRARAAQAATEVTDREEVTL